MKRHIDADTANYWAGLLVDLNSKFRSRILTPRQLEWWLTQSSARRDTIMNEARPARPVASAETLAKFALLGDFGDIVVPNHYAHSNQLHHFGESRYESLNAFDTKISDRNFPHPTWVLEPGDRLHLRVFAPIAGSSATSEECLSFLEAQNAILTGAQGGSLVFDRKRAVLPKGKKYLSFDKPGRLLKMNQQALGTPFIDCQEGGGFRFQLVNFHYAEWTSEWGILCLTV